MFHDEFSTKLADNKDKEIIEHDALETKIYDLDCFSDKQKEEAIAKTKLILAIRNKLNEKGWTQKNVMPIVEILYEAGMPFSYPSLSSIQRWNNKLSNSNDNPAALVTKSHRKGNRPPRANDDKYFELAIKRYLKSVRPTVMSAYRYYKDQITLDIERGLYDGSPISQMAFYKVEKLSNYDVVSKRYGKHKADMKFGYKGGPVALC